MENDGTGKSKLRAVCKLWQQAVEICCYVYVNDHNGAGVVAIEGVLQNSLQVP